MYGKAGLEEEARRVEQHWSSGHFALMNDLTQSLRIGDLIVFTRDGPMLDEVKTNPSRTLPEQKQRIQRALQVLNRQAPLDVGGRPHEHFEAATQLKTRHKDLLTALQIAKKDGIGSSVIRQGWAVAAASIVADRIPTDSSAEEWLLRRGHLIARSGVAASGHMLQSMWSWRVWDANDPLVSCVPFGAFPLGPDFAAELTCGFSMYQSCMSTKLIDDALRAHGFDTEWHLAPANDEPDPSAVVVSVSRNAPDGRRGIGLPGRDFNDLLYEFVEPDRYASALREMFDWSLRHFPRQLPRLGELSRELGHTTMTYSNERAVWFRKG